MPTDDLVARLRAAIDETERIARACEPGVDFHASEDPTKPGTFDAEAYESGSLGNFVQVGQADVPFVAHIVRHDPAAVLRRCAADRKILDMWVIDRHGDLTAEVPGETICDDWCVRVIGEHTLAILAEGYGIKP